jgi:GxxExxY protein
VNQNAVGTEVLNRAMRVHSSLGPGLLESVYELCLAYELSRAGLQTTRQTALPVTYDGMEIEGGFRVDLVVENLVIVEIKAVEKILPVHRSQLLTYLKLSGLKLGYLLNFNVSHMRDGIKRVVNGL